MAESSSIVTPLEREAEDPHMSFEFDGDTWEVVKDFKMLRFARLIEQQQVTIALEYALGKEQYEELEDIIETTDQMMEMAYALRDAMGGGAAGESRASRRSSRKRPRR